MVEADTHVVWDQFNTEGPTGPALCPRGRTTSRLGRDSWRVTTTHVQSFGGQPKTPPSSDDLAELNDYTSWFQAKTHRVYFVS